MEKLALRLQIAGDLLELSKDRGIVRFPGRRVVWISVHYQQHEFHREPSTHSALNEPAPPPEQSAPNGALPLHFPDLADLNMEEWRESPGPFDGLRFGHEIPQVVATDRLLGLRKGTINDDALAVAAELDGFGLCVRTQTSRVNQLALCAQVGTDLLELRHHRPHLRLGWLRQLRVSTYDQQHELHSLLLLSKSPDKETCFCRTCMH